MRFLIVLLAACTATSAWAHHPGGREDATPEALLWTLLAASAVLYIVGVARLWRRAGVLRGVTPARCAWFALGWLALLAALAPPLDALGARYFSAHMVQHEVLMAIAAPLLVLGRPAEAWTWALAPAWRGPIARWVAQGPLARAWDAAGDPLGAWLLHAVAIWAWHAPALFEAALRDPWVHAAQHASFLGTALLFWRAVLGRGVRRPDGRSLAALFTTLLHSGGLGALLTFAPRPWYPAYADAVAGAALTPLEDQQLGGLVMWGPGGLAYVVAGLAIVALWIERRPAPAFR